MHAIITLITWGKSEGEFCKMWNFNPEMINYSVQLRLNPAQKKYTCVGIFMKLIIERELSLLHVFHNSPFSVLLHWSHLNLCLWCTPRYMFMYSSYSTSGQARKTSDNWPSDPCRSQWSIESLPCEKAGGSSLLGDPPSQQKLERLSGWLDQLTHARIEEWSNKRTGMSGSALKLNTVAKHLKHTYIRMVTASIRSFFLWYSTSRLRLHK